MAVIDLIQQENRTAFSFEVLPPLKGTGVQSLFANIERLLDFNPLYINITTHGNEVQYKELPNGTFEKFNLHRRPGTVAIASAIHNRYGLTTVPHVVCSGHTREQIENMLLDLEYLGITDLLVLRGDKPAHAPAFPPSSQGWSHALELEEQINRFNRGIFVDGSLSKEVIPPFRYGVAGYPERHAEAPNMAQDLYWLKKKVENGADYIVTQMFFDNRKYFDFVERARQEGITVPIIPGIKPFTKLSQLHTLPKTFNVELPEEIAGEMLKCSSDEEVQQLGVEWGIHQCKELIAHHALSIHFYSMGATESIRKIAQAIY